MTRFCKCLSNSNIVNRLEHTHPEFLDLGSKVLVLHQRLYFFHLLLHFRSLHLLVQRLHLRFHLTCHDVSQISQFIGVEPDYVVRVLAPLDPRCLAELAGLQTHAAGVNIFCRASGAQHVAACAWSNKHVLPKSSRLLAGCMPASGKSASLTASACVPSLLQNSAWRNRRSTALWICTRFSDGSSSCRLNLCRRCLEAQFVLECVVTVRQEMRCTPGGNCGRYEYSLHARACDHSCSN